MKRINTALALLLMAMQVLAAASVTVVVNDDNSSVLSNGTLKVIKWQRCPSAEGHHLPRQTVEEGQECADHLYSKCQGEGRSDVGLPKTGNR